MKKNLNYGLLTPYGKWRKLFLTMKITAFLLFCGVFNLIASSSYSQNTKISLNMKDATIEDVLNKIEDESEFYFLFNHELIDVERKIDISANNRPIKEILEGIFTDEVNVVVSDRQIVLTQNPNTDFPEESTVQQQTVTGIVKDASNGEVMPGVNVVFKGTVIGTLSDINGRYTIPFSNLNDAILVFSFVGYKSVEVQLGSRTTLDVVLYPDITGLDEVVVIGYGTVKRTDLTGSVGSVDNSMLQQVKVPDALTAIGGRLAGVQIMSSKGDAPGSTPSVRIRGVGSISADSKPLYVIDGFPTDNMDLINPNDIETIDILKDASATAIYGSRGANGVVIINTKRGKTGKANIVFETYQGLQKMARRPDLLNMEEQAWYYYHGIRNENLDAGRDVSGDPLNWTYKVPLTVMNVINGTQSDLYPSIPFNMLDAITQIGHLQSYQLMASGGSEGLRYSINGEYLKDEGIVIKTPFERYSFRVNLDGKLTEKLELSLSTNLVHGENHGVDVSEGGRANGVIGQATSWQLWYPGYNDDESYFVCYGIDSSNNRNNPLAWINEYKAGRSRYRLMNNLALNYEILDGLTLNQRIGVNQNFNHSFQFRPQMAAFANAVARGTDSRSESLNWLSETTLNYRKTLNKHDFTGLIGYTSQKQHNESNYLRSSSFPNNLVYTLNAASNVLDEGNSTISEWSLLSYLSRFTYSYDSKYLLTASIRADGSSRFGSERKYGYFPSFALAWRFSQEDFMSTFSNFLSDGKLRLSYGETGNNNIGNYSHISSISYNSAIIGDDKVGGFEPSQFPNSYLTWEKQRSFNVGLDVGLWKDRITANLDYFYTLNHQLLLDVFIPQITGFNTSLQNIGEVENKGWEFTLRSKNLVGNFTWTTDFNISTFKNKVLQLGPEGAPIIGGRHITQIGQPIGMFYGYELDGVFLTQAELDAGPLYNPGQYDESRLGDHRFVDVSGPDGVPDGIVNTYDRTIIGNPYPDFYYGMTNQFSYKNLNLTIGIRGVHGGDIMSDNDFFLYTRGRYRQYATQRNYFLSEEEPGDGVTPRPNNNPKGGNRQVSSRIIDTGTFLKVNLINLNYTLPDNFTNLLSVSSISTYVNVTNPFTFTRNQSFNPEISSSSSSLEPGVDGDDYPIVTSFTLGLQVTF